MLLYFLCSFQKRVLLSENCGRVTFEKKLTNNFEHVFEVVYSLTPYIHVAET